MRQRWTLSYFSIYNNLVSYVYRIPVCIYVIKKIWNIFPNSVYLECIFFYRLFCCEHFSIFINYFCKDEFYGFIFVSADVPFSDFYYFNFFPAGYFHCCYWEGKIVFGHISYFLTVDSYNWEYNSKDSWWGLPDCFPEAGLTTFGHHRWL